VLSHKQVEEIFDGFWPQARGEYGDAERSIRAKTRTSFK
jgi:hypothetical protein